MLDVTMPFVALSAARMKALIETRLDDLPFTVQVGLGCSVC